MDDNSRQHYIDLLSLTNSLQKGWWGGIEEANTTNYLAGVIATDPNFSALTLTPSDPRFLDQLSLELKSLVLSNPDLDKSNTPSSAIIKDQQKNDRLKTLSDLHKKYPIVFRGPDGKRGKIPLTGMTIPDQDFFLILKKNGLVDDDGNYHTTDPVAIQKAQVEIGKRLTYHRYRLVLQDNLTASLIANAPVSLAQNEILGKDGIPGVADEAADYFAQVLTDQLYQKIKVKQGGTIDLLATGSQAALDAAIQEVRTELLLGLNTGKKTQASRMILASLQRSAAYNRLTPAQQNELCTKSTDAILTGLKMTEAPTMANHSELIWNAAGELKVDLTAAAYKNPAREKTSMEAIPTQPKGIAGKVAQEVGEIVGEDFNSEANINTTDKLQKFWSGLAADPVSAVLNYPVVSILHLLPRPLQNLYFRNTGSQRAWGKLQEKYFYATNPNGLRLFTQDMAYRGIKASLRPFGIVNREGQWVWASALNLAINRGTAKIGEGLASLTSHIPLVGNFLSKTFKRRLGNGKKQDEELLASVLGIFLDIGLGLLKVLPKAALGFISRLPPVQRFKALATQRYFALESRFGFLRTIRTVGGVSSSMVRGILSLNTLAGGSLGSAIGTAIAGPVGGAIGTFVGAASGALYQGWFNIAKNGGLVQLLNLPGGNFIDKFYKFRIVSGPGVFMAEHGWFRLPIKGLFVGYALQKMGVPGLLAYGGPALIQWIWETRDWWGRILASRIPILGRIGSFFSGLATRLGNFFSGLGKLINPGLFMGWQLFPQLGLSSLLGGIVGSGGWLILLKGLGLGAFSGAGWFGWLAGEGISYFLHLAPAQALFVQTLSSLAGLTIAKFGLGTLISLLSGALAPLATALGTFIGTLVTAAGTALGAIAAIATSATFIAVASVAGIAIVITIITAGAFINYSKYQGSVAPVVSECFAPTKTVQVLRNGAVAPDQKAQAGDTLVYTINLNPKSKANEEIKNVVVVDEFAICLEYPGVGPSPAGTKYDLLDIGKLNIYPGSAFQAEGPRMPTAGLNANKPCFREIVWKANSSISSVTRNTEIKYSVQVHGNYPATANFAPAISNLVMVDGEYEITEASGSKRKANCKASISTTVNFSGELVSSMAEKIVKALYECGQRCVDNTNRSQVSACLSQNGIPSAATEEIFRSVSNNGKLQCVGFVQAVEKATGGNLWQVNLASAKDYWRNLAQWGYEQKTNTAANRKNLKAGDILIFVDDADGHMAIVVEPVFDPDGNLAKIVIADAKGDTGCVSPYPLDPLSVIAPNHPSLVGWQTRR